MKALRIQFILILLCTLCTFHAQYTCATDCCVHDQTTQNDQKKIRLTFFVHGIMSIKPHLSFANFFRFITDRIEATLYSETVKYMRDDDFFYKNQAMQGIGLHEIDINRVEKGYASGLVARQFEKVEQLSDPCSNYENHYYTYGWYGLLSTRIRYFDAIPLYRSITAEVAKYRAQGIEPEVRLIGYSHGGNVCLNLGAVRQNEDVDQSIKIDEMILLGVPIQCETDFLLADPIFKRVYQIYSRGDRIQKLDFFSTKRFFSRRIFTERKYFKLPKKLTQIQLRMTRGVRGKRRTCLPCFNPNDVPSISGKSCRFRDAAPGHIELWFYGWTPANYRPNFILEPLPFMIFLPYIIDEVNENLCRAQNPNPAKPIIMDIRPEYEHMIIKNQKSWKDVTIVEFFDKQTMNELKEMVKPYIPDEYDIQTYDDHIQTSLEKAQTDKVHRDARYKGRKNRRRAERKIRKRKRHRPFAPILIS